MGQGQPDPPSTEQQRDNDTLYHVLFDESPFPLSLNELDGRFVDVNRRWTQVTGISRADAIGHTGVELGLVDAETFRRIVEAVPYAGGRLDQFEMLYRTRKGQLRYGLLSTGPVCVGGKELSLSLLEDVTERKQTEEKYRELVQTANSIILRWGLDGHIRFMNEFGLSFFGYAEDEIIGQHVVGTIVPEIDLSGRDLATMMRDILANPASHETNVNENMRKNGERVWIAWTNKLVIDEYGQVKEVLSVGVDVTARKHAEMALRDSERRYRSIFNSNVDAFLLFDEDGVIVDSNSRAAALYGYSQDELIGLSGRDIVDPAYYHVFEDFVSTALDEWFSRESVDVRKDGSRFNVEVHGTRLCYGSKERLLAIVLDVTERNKARESMRLFTDVAENMQSILYIYKLEDLNDDHSLRLTAANPAGTRVLGLRDEDMVGKYIDEIFPSLREHGIPARFAEVARTCIPFSVDDFAYSETTMSSDTPPRHYSFKAFWIPDNRVGILSMDITDLVLAEEEKRQFYRKTIEAATEGKLIVCDRKEIELIAGPSIETCQIVQECDLRDIRRIVTLTAESAGMDEDSIFNLVLCAGEAATNAIKHAHGGVASVHRENDSVIVVVEDHGPGIQAINLPHVALKMGYTTAVSLGMGYKAMISVADKVYLATGSEGTTVAIEMKAHKRDTSVASTLPDTWAAY